MDPIDQIRSVGPHLADHFAAVNRGLETLTLTILPESNVDSKYSDIDGIDPFGHLVVMRQRKLFDDREKLISQIQALPGPGFDTFLPRHSPFSCTSWTGNHHQPFSMRSDIIIVLHNSPPSLITTSDDFYARSTTGRTKERPRV